MWNSSFREKLLTQMNGLMLDMLEKFIIDSINNNKKMFLTQLQAKLLIVEEYY